MNFSLFDVEETTTTPHVRDMIVAQVSPSDVQEFARRYHYTGMPGSACWRWGLWHGPVLHGVVAYNNGNPRMGSAVLGEEHGQKVWHMGRLMIADKSPRNSESRLIGGSLRAIERKHPNVWAVITYADESVGHIGTIYQATNALYTGTTELTSHSPIPFYVNESGQRKAYRAVVDQGRTSLPGWTLCKTDKPKHRYVYILGSKTQRRQRLQLLKLPVFPYPKHIEEGRTV